MLINNCILTFWYTPNTTDTFILKMKQQVVRYVNIASVVSFAKKREGFEQKLTDIAPIDENKRLWNKIL